ncbi:inositol hexakisphosphate and diphosphoinositol-pentakisphosphate [Plasmopara halstedii]|uniref:Inositol hexakisphosphate and diphosphoinositol-pentakisphosphate kinase n=1 Tax=Plasmopara halstedii TaxID=4781 RepID=A0A0P1APE0_PLAHL|nr:inositol hexakisphosphate and diphosphoinositol-pentakisphosphate [Plasmopara halstedii]CEG43145.1 inositol hexakisphosphate and diphosphoinositol-pentakisphosphate [Plasmopara halstedii]|eukprot:XP_024579514.1 inositol hexakisphosphate and diphosphoinositol-pentakisphosphate [Plasmopara halstedii]
MERTKSLPVTPAAMSPPCSPHPVVSKYVVGVCAMEKKTRSKPMREILRRLEKKRQFDVFVFDDNTILNCPVETWPVCDALISFYSAGFPLRKAEEYVRRVRPVLVNDLSMQHILFDRRKVYALLTRHNIQVPRHVIVNRDIPGGKQDDFVEHENYVEVNGERINKPFVEKPANAEDHNIYIYYPTSAGGGSKRLFRKIGDRSSEFYPDVNYVRRDASYIYEEFLNTQGTDVKVYTIGSSYGHAEARKSPVLDGRVLRDSAGKEVRYPVILNSTEKEMARKVCLAFHQTVCGLDLLRVRGSSYVCDVNGWSFVKNSKKYYDDCGLILHNYLVSALRSRYFRQRRASSLTSLNTQMCPQYATEPCVAGHDWREHTRNRQSSGSDISESSVASASSTGFALDDENNEELRCVIAVVRHGDRTPKQKLKTIVWERDLIDFYEKRRSERKFDEVKVKAVADLQELLDLVRSLIKAYAPGVGSKDAVWEVEGGDSFEKLLQLKRVLERWKFSGINRKVQFKPHKSYAAATAAYADAPGGAVKPKILMILKWGGDVTERGKKQGEELGKLFRNSLYPVEVEEGGLLRLHSTFRHDLKIFTSDEGRVQVTAAAFAKGFLELDGDLTPILVSLVTTLGRDANKMLDHSGQADANEEMQTIKVKLRALLQRDYSSMDEMKAAIAPLKTESIIQALDFLRNPKEALISLLELVRKLRAEIAERVQDKQSDEVTPLCMGETFSLMFERWDKIYRDFYSSKTDTFNLSKIPDVHDCIKYDLLHNSCVRWKCGLELFKLAEALARCYVSQEYGMDIAEKQSIGNRVSQALCAKIRADIVTVMSASAEQEHVSLSSGNLYGNSDVVEDGTADTGDQDIEHHGYRLDPSYAKELRIKSPGTQIRTRLYFTSESHLHTLLNVLRFQCPSWRARHEGGEDDEYDISLEQEKFSNEILKRMGISVNDHMTQRKYVYRESKLISDSSRRALDRVAEINYLAHIVIRVFETPSLPEDSEDRFRVEISFSPGVKDGLADSPDGADGVEDMIFLTKNMTGVMFEDMLATCVSSVQSSSV